jgi:hypothetical protein
MLAFHPDLVDLPSASPALADEVQDADAALGRAHFERFVTAIVEAAS